MSDIIIVGGGISGVAAALELAREGAKVTLLERHRLAAMASGWTLGGVRQSGRDPAELPLARAAVDLWATLGAELGTDVGYRRGGNLRFARTPDEVEVIRAMVDRQRELGLDLTFLPDGDAVRALAPAVGPNVLAASFCPTDGHAEPVTAVRALAQAAERAGAKIIEGIEVTTVCDERGQIAGVGTSKGFIAADMVVVAAGVHTPELIAPLGLDLPLAPRVVSVLQTAPLPAFFAQVFGVANADCAGRQEIDGRLRVTGGIGPWRHPVSSWSEDALAPPASDVARLIALVGHVLPALLEAPIVRLWGGLIDSTPDALPVIDAPGDMKGLVIAAGFSGHGFGLGPITGKLIADLALGRSPRFDLSAFRLERFAGAARSAIAPLTMHG